MNTNNLILITAAIFHVLGLIIFHKALKRWETMWSIIIFFLIIINSMVKSIIGTLFFEGKMQFQFDYFEWISGFLIIILELLFFRIAFLVLKRRS